MKWEEIIKLRQVDFSQLSEIYEIFAQIETNLEFLNAIAAFKVFSSSPSAKTTFFCFFFI